MDKLKINSETLKIFLIAALLIITPLLSTSFRSTYLYFIVNILIIVVGAEAGLVSFFLKPPENKKRTNSSFKPGINDDHNEKKSAQLDKAGTNTSPDNLVGTVKEKKVTKSPSTPSIFFIEGVTETESTAAEAEELLVEDHNDIQGQELFHKAETFIGNFYKQLKMQREESWKKLHEIYQKAF